MQNHINCYNPQHGRNTYKNTRALTPTRNQTLMCGRGWVVSSFSVDHQKIVQTCMPSALLLPKQIVLRYFPQAPTTKRPRPYLTLLEPKSKDHFAASCRTLVHENWHKGPWSLVECHLLGQWRNCGSALTTAEAGVNTLWIQPQCGGWHKAKNLLLKSAFRRCNLLSSSGLASANCNGASRRSQGRHTHTHTHALRALF